MLTLIERGKGNRSFHVDGTKVADLLPLIKETVAPDTYILTYEVGQYADLKKHFARHYFMHHGRGEYVRDTVHTNTVESYYSVFKRGMKDIYQQCVENYLYRYVAEFDFPYSKRVRLDVDDVARTVSALRGVVGKRLMYSDSSLRATLA